MDEMGGKSEKIEGMREFTRPRVRLDSPSYAISMFGFDIWDIAPSHGFENGKSVV